jgi:adenine phosphoribosyltransferase
MKYYTLNLCGLERKLPIVSLGPEIKIASFSLLGDREMTEAAAKELAKRLQNTNFDLLAGPEVKVVPLLHALSQKLNKKRYIVCRKKIHGYMSNPQTLESHPTLVLNGPDATLVKSKKIVVVDDVISTGSTLNVVKKLIEQSGGEVVANAVLLRQGKQKLKHLSKFIYLGELPLFKSS